MEIKKKGKYYFLKIYSNLCVKYKKFILYSGVSRILFVRFYLLNSIIMRELKILWEFDSKLRTWKQNMGCLLSNPFPGTDVISFLFMELLPAPLSFSLNFAVPNQLMYIKEINQIVISLSLSGKINLGECQPSLCVTIYPTTTLLDYDHQNHPLYGNWQGVKHDSEILYRLRLLPELTLIFGISEIPEMEIQELSRCHRYNCYFAASLFSKEFFFSRLTFILLLTYTSILKWGTTEWVNGD